MRSDLLNDLIELTTEHLVLVSIAMVLAILIAVPAGVYLTRHEGARKWMLGFASVMQTIPAWLCSVF